MLGNSNEELVKQGANITVTEIRQQPELWLEVINNYEKNEKNIVDYLTEIKEKHNSLKVIFTGAGTSAFVGQSISPYLNKVNRGNGIVFESIATTDIVASPELFLDEDQPTVLVSFARSGNSPESISTVDIAKKIIKNLYQITITCAQDGKIAQYAEEDSKNLLLLQPEKSNDQGFAMTGSYTCMTLTALLIFDPSENKMKWAKDTIEMGDFVLNNTSMIEEVVKNDFSRVVYLGSGGLYGVAREAQLKILELTAGQIATLYETPLGFRHGPKSFIDENTLVITFMSNNEYTKKYDADLLNEVFHDEIAEKTISLSVGNNNNDANSFEFNEKYKDIPDAYLTLPYIIYGQLLAVMTALKVGNTPDTPSKTGTVNRVVQGVIIHELNQ